MVIGSDGHQYREGEYPWNSSEDIHKLRFRKIMEKYWSGQELTLYDKEDYYLARQNHILNHSKGSVKNAKKRLNSCHRMLDEIWAERWPNWHPPR